MGMRVGFKKWTEKGQGSLWRGPTRLARVNYSVTFLERARDAGLTLPGGDADGRLKGWDEARVEVLEALMDTSAGEELELQLKDGRKIVGTWDETRSLLRRSGPAGP